MSDNDTTAIKYRTVTLTDRPPVRIREDQWPCIAHGTYECYDNQYRFQANRITDINIRVRQHQDGRSIVYAVYDYTSNYQGESGLSIKAGMLCDPGADLAQAIKEVGRVLTDRLNGRHLCDQVGDVIADCIADLPAETLP